MVFNLQLVGLVVSLIWLGILTYLFWQISSHYNNLTRNFTEKSLKHILEDIMHNMQTLHHDTTQMHTKLTTLQKESSMHIQKVGLLRFNPFKDTGGDQSFILALLDGNTNGVVISGLYSRSGTRWYAKRIVSGKGVEYELSDEEKRAIQQAVPMKEK